MGRYILRRVLQGLLATLGVFTLVFVLIRVSGDPVALFIDPNQPAEVVEAQKAAVRKTLGLDRPVLEQYVRFLWGAFQGDFGNSFRFHVPAIKVVFERLPLSLKLGAVATGWGVLIGLPLGIFAALRRGSLYDNFATTLAVLGFSIPNFFMGIMLIIVFAVQFKILPSSGSATWKHMILPAFAQSASLMALVCRMGRSEMLEVLRQDYIRTARAKGLKERVVMLRHALRNALTPVITVVALYVPYLIGNILVIEVVFAWPGLGRLMVYSVFARDYPVVLAGAVVMAVISVITFVLMDLLYVAANPTVRLK